MLALKWMRRFHRGEPIGRLASPLLTGLALLAVLVSLVPLGADQGLQESDGKGASTSSAAGPSAADGEQAARQLCSTCHKLPPPQVLARAGWRDQVARMWLIVQNQPEPLVHGVAARTVSLPPDWQSIVEYYESAAPQTLAAPPGWPAPDSRLVFRRRTMTLAGGPADPAISNVRLADLGGDKRLEVVAGDLRHGVIMAGEASSGTLTEVASVPHPAHIEPVDFDRDGIVDLAVGDLGAFMPTDHDRGAVVWLRGRKDGTYGQLSLDKWPPVADVRAADFDGDGRLDLAVAAFGWRKTGALVVLRNDTTDYTQPGFIPSTVEQRTGAIHAPPVDLNKDGRPDLVVLFSQEHEAVVAFLNGGPGRPFERNVIYQAPHPMWGSSGMEMVDLDADGDLDVLLTNGDSYDRAVQKPYHGIVWLENRGVYPFAEHALAKLGGAHRALAGDLDLDGDLDIVACALAANQEGPIGQLPALVWLEQTSRGVFERHTLEAGIPTHATLDIGDIDGDGDIDLVVGNFVSGSSKAAPIDVWENLRK
jgi:hypothetical protein